VTGTARVTAVAPGRAIEGGRVTIFGSDFPVDQPLLPDVRVGNLRARVVYASPTRIAALVPSGITESGRVPVSVAGIPGEVAFLEVAVPFATGLHQVDNPVFDREGNLYVTYSGTRGQQVPVSIFRASIPGVLSPGRPPFGAGSTQIWCADLDEGGQNLHVASLSGPPVQPTSDGTWRPLFRNMIIACKD